MVRYAGVEIGGTKTDVVFGTSMRDMSTPVRIPTSSPDRTLAEIAGVIGSQDVTAVGIACFGPLDRELGAIGDTPKPGWSGAAVRATIERECSIPVTIDLDVNGSAMGEGRWGAAVGLDDYVYVTVGTGIGAGVIVGGEPIGRSARHPEAGHIVVERHPEDTYEGHCPFHADCLEGMASGPALEDRFGPPSSWTSREDQIVAVAVHYLAQGMRDLIYTVAPEMIVVGGGVSRLPAFHDRLKRRTVEAIGGYPKGADPEWIIVPPGLGDLSGLAGALVLAGNV